MTRYMWDVLVEIWLILVESAKIVRRAVLGGDGQQEAKEDTNG